MDKPEKLDTFIWILMHEAKRDNLMDLLDSVEISEEQYNEIKKYFKTLSIEI